MVNRYTMVVMLMIWALLTQAQIHYRPVSLPDTTDLNLTPIQYPVDGVLVSGHGWRNGRIHHGLDISHNNRDTVRSSWLGRVRYARKGYNGGYGYLVIVTHLNGLETYYAHLRELLVEQGDWIPQGCPVGIVGSTGNSLGPHLHYEIRYCGLSIDPSDLIDKDNIQITREGSIYKVTE